MTESTIMVVDSDPESSRFLVADLREDGYSVISAMDGFEALKQIKQQDFKLIILARSLNDIDGIRLSNKIRIETNNQMVPIIIISSFDDDEDQRSAKEAGANGYLCMPFVFTELSEMIKELI